MERFQFIGFPSEWGAGSSFEIIFGFTVSNLLGSPASGECTPAALRKITPTYPVSNLLGSPASGEALIAPAFN